MRRIRLVLASALLASLGTACQQDPSEVGKKLDQIQADINEIKQAIKSGAGARAPARPQRPPGPDPKLVYSVPIDGAPFRGADHAKVTVVEAFEFA